MVLLIILAEQKSFSLYSWGLWGAVMSARYKGSCATNSKNLTRREKNGII